MSAVDATPHGGLRRTLGFRDLVLLNVAAILGLRWWATAAQIGPVGLTFWALGALLFFVPLGLAVAELGTALPGEGGLYQWSRAAFGELHGFVAGWCYWFVNVVFLPTMLLTAADWALYVGPAEWRTLADDPLYNAAFALALLWGATLLNVVGLDRAKWLNNVGGAVTWVILALLVAAAALAAARYGSATAFDTATYVPDVTRLTELAALATIAYAYVGLEAGSTMGEEIVEPRRTLPRAILVSGVLIAVTYAAGTAALLVALPSASLDAVAGLPDGFAALAARLGLPWLLAVSAVLLVVSQLGGVGAWITATARLPFVMGFDRYLPPVLGRVHPRWGSPWVALVAQGVLASAVVLLALGGGNVRLAYAVLMNTTIIVTFVPMLYVFASLPVLRARDRGLAGAAYRIPGGLPACVAVAVLGIGVTLLAMAAALVPPPGTDPRTFVVEVVGGCVALIGLGVAAVLVARWRAHHFWQVGHQ